VETSGGLLICLPADAADKFCRDFEEATNGEQKSFQIGHVTAANESDAVLCEDVEFIEVSL